MPTVGSGSLDAGTRARRASKVFGLALAAVLLAGLGGAALAIINLRFTPADLVRGSSDVFMLRASAPQKGEMETEILETLKGKAPDAKKLSLTYSDAKDLTEDELVSAFAGAQSATAVLLVAPVQEGDAAGTRSGSLLIGTRWFTASSEQGKWRVDKDTRDLFAVWAGSARMLADAARYVESDPTAFFPVRSDLSWGSDRCLGKVPGQTNGCLLAQFGAPNGTCVVVLSDGGDRAFSLAAKEGQPADITDKLKLPSASKLAALGDFNGDGRLDLACWDGKGLKLALQAADGTFTLRPTAVNLAACLSLDTLNVGAAGAGLLAGTPGGPILLLPDAQDGFKAAPLPHEVNLEALAPGGYCVVADLDGDGRCDVMQLFTRGAFLYSGEALGKFKAPVKLGAPGVKNPRAAVCGDFDTDGLLDVVVGGEDGLALLSHAENRRLENNAQVTGELIYHGGQNSPVICTASAADVNSDGRQGIALFYSKQKPMVFFNRGFACFGWARELDLVDPPTTSGLPFEKPPDQVEAKLKGTEVLQGGQTGGLVWDLNGDGADDLLGVTPQGEVWVLYGRAENRRPLGLTLSLSAKSQDPLTVTVSDQRRRVGMCVLRPGRPCSVGRLNPGPFTLEWRGPDGKARTKKVAVVGLAQVEIDPLAEP